MNPTVTHETLQQHIRQSVGAQVQGLAVTYSDDEAVIFGECGTYYTKQIATRAVRELLPRAMLRNEIQVCRS